MIGHTLSSVLAALPSAPAAANVVGVIAEAALKATPALAAGWLLARALRRSSASARHLAWLSAVVAALAVPLLTVALPAWRVLPAWSIELRSATDAPAPVADPAPAQPPSSLPPPPMAGPQPDDGAFGDGLAGSRTPAFDPPSDRLTDGAASAVRPSAAAADAPPPPVIAPPAAPTANVVAFAAPAAARTPPARTPWAAWAVAVWAAGAVAVLLPLPLGWLAVRRLARRAGPPDGPWAAACRAAADRLGVGPGVRVLVGAADAMPMTWGVVRPTVLLPAVSASWDAPRRRAAALHEFAHVRRRDCLTQALARLACAVYWFHPLAWAAAAGMRAERERACDDLVLTAGADPVDYAGQLLAAAAGLRPGRVAGAAAVAMARRPALEGRLTAILDPAVRRSRPRPALVAVAALALAGVVLPVAALRARAAADAPPTVPVTSATPTATTPTPTTTPAAPAAAPAVPVAPPATSRSAMGPPLPSPTTPGAATWPSTSPATARPAAPGVAGRVVSARGEPVAGATVSLLDRTESVGAPSVEATATTAPDGTFRFPDAANDPDAAAAAPRLSDGGRRAVREVLVEAAGHGMLDAFVGGTPTDVRLKSAAELRVRLVAADGKPAAGVRAAPSFVLPAGGIEAWSAFRPIRVPREVQRRRSAAADADGWVALADLPRGSSVQLALDPAEERFANPASDDRAFVADAPATSIDPFRLRPGTTISGRATFAGTGEPAAGVTLTAASIGATGGSAWGMAVTGPDGRYRMTRMPAGTYDVIAHLGDALAKDWAAAAVVGVTLAEGRREVPDKDLTLVRGGLLAGRVTLADTGAGAAGVTVGVQGPARPQAGGTSQSTVTAADGSFALRVPPGRQRVFLGMSVPPDGYQLPLSDHKSQLADVADGETTTVAFALDRDTGSPAAGVVVGQDGRPAAGAVVVAERPTNGGGEGSPTRTATADADGRFRFAALPPGTRLRASRAAADGGGRTTRAVTLDGGEQDVRLALGSDAPSSVLVTVRDPDGKPIAGANVVLSTRIGNLGMSMPDPNALTGADGTFEIKNLQSDQRYDVDAKAPGFGEGQAKVPALNPGEQTKLGPIVLKRADAAIAGRVVGTDRRPLAGVAVRINGGSSGFQVTQTDADGRFRFAVPADAAPLLYTAGKYGHSNRPVDARAGDVDVTLVHIEEQPTTAPTTPVVGPGNPAAAPGNPAVRSSPSPAAGAWLGASIGSVRSADRSGLKVPGSPPPVGVQVRAVVTGGPAEAAGLRAGDVLLKWDGDDLWDTRFAQRLRAARAGDVVVFAVWRDGAATTARATLEDFPRRAATSRPATGPATRADDAAPATALAAGPLAAPTPDDWAEVDPTMRSLVKTRNEAMLTVRALKAQLGGDQHPAVVSREREVKVIEDEIRKVAADLGEKYILRPATAPGGTVLLSASPEPEEWATVNPGMASLLTARAELNKDVLMLRAQLGLNHVAVANRAKELVRHDDAIQRYGEALSAIYPVTRTADGDRRIVTVPAAGKGRGAGRRFMLTARSEAASQPATAPAASRPATAASRPATAPSA